MKSDLEIAWCKATPDERQDLVESYADELRQLLPRYNDYDDPETEELLVQGDDDGDDETLDAPELPSLLDTNSISDDDGDFAAEQVEDFREATRGIKRRATGKRVTAAPRSAAEIETLTAEFLAGGGAITRVERGFSGLQPPPKRIPAWRKIASNKGA